MIVQYCPVGSVPSYAHYATYLSLLWGFQPFPALL